MDRTKNTDQDQAPQERRPYVKPGVVSEQVFETMALSCASGPECQFQGPDKS